MNLGNKQPLKDYGQIQSCQNYLKIEDEKNLKQQKNLFLKLPNERMLTNLKNCDILPP